jgi:hypothetical protein
MCPVEEIGRNSVMPSIIPRITTTNHSGIDDMAGVRREKPKNDKIIRGTVGLEISRKIAKITP